MEMNKTLAETLKLLLNNQKILAEQVAILNEKIKLLQQSQGQVVVQQKKARKSLISLVDNTDDEPTTVH